MNLSEHYITFFLFSFLLYSQTQQYYYAALKLNGARERLNLFNTKGKVNISFCLESLHDPVPCQHPGMKDIWKRKEGKIKVKTSRGSSHSLPVEKWWTLTFCFVQFPSQTMPLFALLYGTRDGNSPSAIYINSPNQHSVLILTRKIVSLRLIGHSTTPYLLTETTTYCMLQVTGHKVAKTLRGFIPTLAILLWTPQAPPESPSSEPSYTFPFQQKAV